MGVHPHPLPTPAAPGSVPARVRKWEAEKQAKEDEVRRKREEEHRRVLVREKLSGLQVGRAGEAYLKFTM